VVPERLAAVLAELAPVAERFDAAGHRVYLVGGIVRDLLLGRTVREDDDFDLTTDARPEQTEAVVRPIAEAVWLQGKRFGTIGCRVAGRELEITTHRAEAYRPESRKPEVRFADVIEADLSRRDFTVNAMALRLSGDSTAEGVELIDPFDGAADLAASRLRTPLDPETSFTDDPLRMLRAARFIAGFGLRPDPELVAAVEALHERLEIVSAERIRDELDRLVTVEKPGAGLWFLVDTGVAGEFLPELPALRLAEDPVHRHKDVLAHTVAVVERALPAEDRILRLAALFHDVGKPKTRSFEPGGKVTFHHHEVVGARMTRERMTALRYPADDVEQVSRLVELHLRFHGYDEGAGGWTDSAVRRYARDAGPLLRRLNDLTRADCTTRNRRKAAELADRMDKLEARIAALEEAEELASLRPDLDGNEVMELLGIGPGPQVGRAMAFLKELRIEEGPLGKEEAGRRLLEVWAAEPR
jgi:poly(A) polymerase